MGENYRLNTGWVSVLTPFFVCKKAVIIVPEAVSILIQTYPCINKARKESALPEI